MRLNRKLSTIISLLLILMFCLPYSYAMADGPVPVITKNPTSEENLVYCPCGPCDEHDMGPGGCERKYLFSC